MFNINDYVISMFDTVETGREKINFLLTGDSSPFNMWSGTPEFLNYESLSRIDANNSNYIYFTTDSSSGNSPFNLIFNGSGNTINTIGSTNFPYGGFNLIDGTDNSVIGSYFNSTIGKGNYLNGGSFLGGGFNFIHGVNDQETTGVFTNISNLLGLSSKNININYFNNSTILSSNDLSLNGGNSFSFNNYNFLSGSYNNLLNQNSSLFGTTYYLDYIFLGEGSGNTINGNSKISNFNSIINGTNNTINTDGVNIYNANLFGSNLTVVDNNYSHFQNLYSDGGLYATKVNNYLANNGNENITLDLNYSFHEINVTTNFPIINIYIPNSNVGLQFLSLILNFSNLTYEYFFTENNFSTPAINIACKSGNGSRFSSIVSPNTSVAYFFIWVPMINKWVMYTSDTDTTATF